MKFLNKLYIFTRITYKRNDTTKPYNIHILHLTNMLFVIFFIIFIHIYLNIKIKK